MTLTESTLSSTTSDLGARSSRTFLLISSESLNSVLVENATFLNRMAEGLAAAVNSDYRTFFRLQPHQFEIDEILYEARAVRITVTAVDPVSVEIALLRVIDERGLRVDPFNAAREGSTIELDVTTNAPQDGGDESPATLTVQEDKDEKLSRDVVIGLIIFATCVVVIAAFALSSWNRDSRRSPPHAEHDFSVGPPMVANKSFRYDTQSQGHLPKLVSSSSLMQLQLNPYLAQNGRVDTSI